MSEYDDRTKWSDEKLLEIFKKPVCDICFPSEDIRAALLKRMGQAEAQEFATIDEVNTAFETTHGERWEPRDMFDKYDILMANHLVADAQSIRDELLAMITERIMPDPSAHTHTFPKTFTSGTAPAPGVSVDSGHPHVPEPSTAEPKLLPCPFCGMGVVIRKEFVGDSSTKMEFVIKCDNNDCSVECDVWCKDKEEAIKAWNMRADIAALDAPKEEIPEEDTSNSFPPQVKICPTCGTGIGIEGDDEPDRDTAPAPKPRFAIAGTEEAGEPGGEIDKFAMSDEEIETGLKQAEFDYIAEILLRITHQFAILVGTPEKYYEYAEAIDAVEYLRDKYSYSYGLACEDCGLPYSSFGLDTYLPNDQWELVTKGKPSIFLCTNCIIKRARVLTCDPSLGVTMNIGFPLDEQGRLKVE